MRYGILSYRPAVHNLMLTEAISEQQKANRSLSRQAYFCRVVAGPILLSSSSCTVVATSSFKLVFEEHLAKGTKETCWSMKSAMHALILHQ